MSDIDNSDRIRSYRAKISEARKRIRKYEQALERVTAESNDLNSAIIELDNAIAGLKENFIKNCQVYQKKETEKVKDQINKVSDQLKRIVVPKINSAIIKEEDDILKWQDRIAALQD